MKMPFPSIIAVCVFMFVFLRQGFTQEVKNIFYPEVPLDSQDRILILAPHPDDEVLACGGIIQKAVKLNLPLRIVFFTYGDNNEWSFVVYRKHPVVMPKAVREMGLIRHDEAIQADNVLGVSADKLTFLGYPDFKTLNIWYSHWGKNRPAESMFTHVNAVPYNNAMRPGAPYKGEEILKDLKTILQEFKPTKIFLSHPADHNPDHRSLYLFTRVAVWDLEGEIRPILYPYLVHFKQWPMPRGYHPNIQLEPPQFFSKDISWQMLGLGQEEVSRNYNAIQKHHSQYESCPDYLLSFIRPDELFGDFAVITLGPQTSPVMLSAIPQEEEPVMHEELTDAERAAFIGVEEHSMRIENNHLVLSLKLSRPLGKTVGLSVYAFGYRKDKPFAEMPKLHIRFGALKHTIFDQNRKLSPRIIEVKHQAKEITIRIPLDVLGNPQRILTSSHTYLGLVPLDWVSWRIVEI